MRLIAEHSTQFNDIYDRNCEMYTESEIMKMTGAKKTLYSKCKRMLVETMNSDVWPFEWDKPKMCRKMPLYEHVIRELRGY